MDFKSLTQWKSEESTLGLSLLDPPASQTPPSLARAGLLPSGREGGLSPGLSLTARL